MLLWLVAIAVVAAGELLPGNSRPMEWIGASHISDKLLHFSAYTGLAFIPVLGFRLRAGLVAAASMILLGIALEYGQTLVPGRSFDSADMAANAAGVFLGASIGLLIRKRPKL
ncbi:MAG: VanZ family protein [Acidobacteriota bacterium]